MADAIARTETGIRKRGQAAGPAADRTRRHRDRHGARRAIDEVFGALDDEALLEAALAKRLRGRAIASPTSASSAGSFDIWSARASSHDRVLRDAEEEPQSGTVPRIGIRLCGHVTRL